MTSSSLTDSARALRSRAEARRALRSGSLSLATEWLQQRLAAGDHSDRTLGLWFELLEAQPKPPQAVVRDLLAFARSHDARWIAHASVGAGLERLGFPDEAERAFQRALRLDPARTSVWLALGALHRRRGRAAEAQVAFERALQINPHHPAALRLFGYEHRYQLNDPPFRRVLAAMVGVDGLGPVGAIDIHYAIAKAFEDVGDIDAAFQHFTRAGSLQAARTRWSPSQDRRLIAALRDRVTAEHYAALRREATASSKPVFIVGMPRSGTTLIEQIIASHPDAAGCGEPDAAPGVLDGLCLGPLTIDTTTGTTGVHLVHGRGLSIAERGAHYLQALEQRADPGRLRLVDKLTTNHRWVGVLDCILPGSHFIHAQRHPAETCLSLFRLWFGDQISYSYTLADLAAAYRLCHDFMQHWRALLPPGRILDIRHEDLVADPEFQARRIFAFIGLPWDERCLRFYQSERRIATASAIQVRRPIYTAPPRWRRYVTHLAPLLEALSDLIGDYEASGSDEHHP